MKRSFLFLQGPASPYFNLLGEELLDQGHRVLRINFNSGDRFFWNGENTADYKHPLTEFSGYIDNVAKLRKITDLVIYDENRPLHQAAIEALKHHKIRIHVFGEGYFGENWITLEDRIFGNKTVLPKDPRFYLRAKEEELPRARKFSGVSRAKSLYMLHYYLASIFRDSGNFPMHDEYNPFESFGSYLKSGVAGFFRRQRKLTAKQPYFLADSELSRKASFIRSFANSAQPDDNLVFFAHGRITADQAIKTHELAEKYKVSHRITMVENCSFAALVKSAKGYITNNNKSALTAISHGKPVMALAEAIFNIGGLTNQCAIAEFWAGPVAPNSEIYRKFRNYLIARTQVIGNFYNRKALQLSVDNAARKILGKGMDSENSGAIDVS